MAREEGVLRPKLPCNYFQAYDNPSVLPDSLNLAVIGNCQIAALIDQHCKIVWSCLPCFDADPVFCSLLKGNQPNEGFFDILVENLSSSQQAYIKNTAVLVTRLFDQNGNGIEVTDFCPRFTDCSNNLYRPAMLVRIVRATPVIGAEYVSFTSSDAHLLYLSTDGPVSFITSEIPFLLTNTVCFLFGTEKVSSNAISTYSAHILEETVEYWEGYSSKLRIPFDFQSEIVRSAITIKLMNFESTGAVVAALTTSIPEHPATTRIWDYRLSWIHDSFHLNRTLYLINDTATIQCQVEFLSSLLIKVRERLDVLAEDEKSRYQTVHLQPVYSIQHESVLKERTIRSLPGYMSFGLVRIGNSAYLQTENDVYGSIISVLVQAIVDQRFGYTDQKKLQLFEVLEKLGERAVAIYDQPDCGIWEMRGVSRLHTLSAVMCWIAAERLAFVSGELKLVDRQIVWANHAKLISAFVQDRFWNESEGSIVSCLDRDCDHVDASLLLLGRTTKFLDSKDFRFVATVRAVQSRLSVRGAAGEFLIRHKLKDDFGAPSFGYNQACFWLVSALHEIGDLEAARTLFQTLLKNCNTVGLWSEHICPVSGSLWGNFPHLGTHCALICAASALSRKWEEMGF